MRLKLQNGIKVRVKEGQGGGGRKRERDEEKEMRLINRQGKWGEWIGGGGEADAFGATQRGEPRNLKGL